MKKIISIFMILSIFLCGCSSTNEAQQAVESYYTDMQEGKWQEAISYYSDDYQDSNDLSELSNEYEQEMKEMNLSDKAQNEMEDFISYMMSQYVKEFSIIDCTKKEDSIVVNVNVTGIDFHQLQTIDTSSFASNQEMTKEEFEEQLPNYIKNYKKAIQKIDAVEREETLTLISTDEGWKINDITNQS